MASGASNADVDMEAVATDIASADGTTRHAYVLLNAIATGSFQDLPHRASSTATRDGNTTDDEALLLAPFLPLLTRLDHARSSHALGRHASSLAQSSHALSKALVHYEQVNALREYAHVFQMLQLTDIERFVHQQLREQQKQQQAPREGDALAAAQADAMPIYRRFENGNAQERTCIVLAEVYTQSFQARPSRVVRESELFSNEIYKDELVAILVSALASVSLQVEAGSGAAPHTTLSPFRLSSVVQFCMNIPLGVEVLESLVLNDPSIVDRVLDAVIESLSHLPSSPDAVASLPVAFLHAQEACLALARLAPAYAALARSKLSGCNSLWAMAIAFRLTTATPALHDDLAIFLFQLMKNEATSVSASGLTASVSVFSAYLSLGLADSGDVKQDGHPLQQTAIQNLSPVRQHLLDRLEHAPAPLAIVSILNVYIGFLALANFRPSDQETMQLLRWFDKSSKDPKSQVLTSRVVSLAYILVVFLCYPLAPSLNKIPSQREESTKTILALSQQCIFSLYNTKTACPLFIITAVLLYTKSPSLLPFLASVIGNDGLPVQALRVEYLHVFGDVVLKPILTENIMAREVLTFAPAAGFDAFDEDILSEMTLRGIYGLLCEKSFLRHHHGRKLEEWMTNQLDEAVLPIHPLMLNILLEWIENYVVAFEYPIAQKPLLQLSIIPLRSSTVNKWLNARCLAQQYDPPASGSEVSESVARGWAKGVLALTYALQFNQRVRHAMMVPGSKISELSTDAYPASGDVCLFYELNEFPLRNMVHQVLSHGGKAQLFEYVAPTLLRLMIEEYPHRVGTALPAVLDQSDLERCWFRKRQRLHLEYLSSMDQQSLLTPESWMALHLFVSELETAPSRILVKEFEVLVDRILPCVIRTRKTLQDPFSLMYGEEFCAQISDLYENRVQHEHFQRSALKMKLVHAICFPDLVWKHYQQRRDRPPSSHAAALNHLVTYSQVVEEPFRLLSDAHGTVYQSPALLRLLLVLLRGFRDAANVHLKNQDPALIPRKQLLQGAPPPAGESSVSSSHATKTTSIQQHMLVQDCLIVHALLKKMAIAADTACTSEADVQRECNSLLCKAVAELFQDEQSSSLSPHRLIAAVHHQGYDSSLIPVLIENVPSMCLLWEHWMQTPAASGASGPSSSSSGTRSTQGKVLNEFIADVSERDLIKWKFRLQLYFSLCGKYFNPAQTAAVLQVMKLVWNKLRNVLMSAISAASSGATHSEDLRVHAAFLDEILPLAVAACAQHPELSAELVQFLLKLQKQGGSSTAASAGSTWRKEDASRIGKDLDEVLHDAYALLLEQI